MLGSAPMMMGLWDRIKQALPNVTLSIGYGTTEAGPAVIQSASGAGISNTPPLALGYPIDPETVKLINGTETEGVLLMRNPALMDPIITRRSRLQGDHRRLVLQRRCDASRRRTASIISSAAPIDMFVCSGENVYPGEGRKSCSNVIRKAQQAVVVPLPDEERSRVPVAFIVTRADAKPTADDDILENSPSPMGRPISIRAASSSSMNCPWAGTRYNKIDRKSLIDRVRASSRRRKGWSA